MSYQLRQSQTLGDNLRRVCREQVERAIAKGEKESPDTPVHETRKHLKKARAALRLVRKEIGRGLCGVMAIRRDAIKSFASIAGSYV